MRKTRGTTKAGLAGHTGAPLGRRAFCGLALLGGMGALSFAGCAADGAVPGDAGEKEAADKAPAQESADDEGAGNGDAATSPADAAAPEPVKASTFAFNTLVNITAYGVDDDVVSGCLNDCATYEGLFSARKEGTDVARINEAGGAPVEVSADTADLIAAGLDYGRQTDGAFDITIGSVSLLWDFVNAVKPDDAAIAEGLKHIDYTQVSLDGTTVTMGDPEARLDLGGIAKGWIAARLAEKLEQAGCTAGLVDLGTSSVYAIGTKPDGTPWRVGLRDPKDSMSSLAGVVEVADEAITSSGLYDQEFELDGQTYWHILDPKTGYPAQTDMLGVTLIGADPTQGDALSTTLSVMGIEEGTAWVEEHHPELAAMFVNEDDEATFANGFESHGYAPVASGSAK